jgi:hypothetical protein
MNMPGLAGCPKEKQGRLTTKAQRHEERQEAHMDGQDVQDGGIQERGSLSFLSILLILFIHVQINPVFFVSWCLCGLPLLSINRA